MGALLLNAGGSAHNAFGMPVGLRAPKSENRSQRGQFLPDQQAHSPAVGQEAGEKWTAEVDVQPAISKPNRLPAQPPWPSGFVDDAATLRVLEHLQREADSAGYRPQPLLELLPTCESVCRGGTVTHNTARGTTD